MEIERKFLIKRENLPENLEQYPSKVIEQGYLCTEPVVRIRKSNDNYYLTYKSKGLLAREEYNLPLTKEAYEHLKPKADGIVISKVRYVIPEKDGLSIELDVFKAPYEGLLLAEVEFPTEEAAHAYQQRRRDLSWRSGLQQAPGNQSWRLAGDGKIARRKW